MVRRGGRLLGIMRTILTLLFVLPLLALERPGVEFKVFQFPGEPDSADRWEDG